MSPEAATASSESAGPISPRCGAEVPGDRIWLTLMTLLCLTLLLLIAVLA
jgi:hypothetical protein